MYHCSRLGRLLYFYSVMALFIAAGVFGCASTQSTPQTCPPPKGAVKPEKTVTPGQVQRPVNLVPGMVAFFPPPVKIDFCGEPVPLDNQEVMERFDKEFTLIVYNNAQVYRWLKRKDRYFPWIEERLRRLNLPDDLKYLALAESESPLNPSQKRRPADTRYDFASSPESALQHLGDLYRTLRSWPLAIAAYYGGERHVMDESRGQRDFYSMTLPQDTDRAVFRIMAIKVVLSNPTQYGYELPKGAGYR